MSGYAPINSDHAVVSVAFSVLLTAPLNQDRINRARASHDVWRDDLPAVDVVPGVHIGIGPSGVGAQLPSEFVTFAYKRPDGTPAWQLRFEPFAITVECSRYTRWDRVSEKAFRLLKAAIAATTDLNNTAEPTTCSIVLIYVDRFLADSDSKPDQLLQPSRYVPAFVFDSGGAWHTNSGWFDAAPNGEIVLNHLNLDASLGNYPADLNRLVVSVVHYQEFRYAEANPLQLVVDNSAILLEAPMGYLHEANKSLIESVLTSEVGNQIGLTLSDKEG